MHIVTLETFQSSGKAVKRLARHANVCLNVEEAYI
jgi:hypothetical protein